MSRDPKSHRTVTVIGAGPAGMTAAICAARQGAGVRLIEKNKILGRKLLATGNGRCNLTNMNSPDAEKTLCFFAELGLLTRSEEEGRVYPYSEQAAAVQEALTGEMEAVGVEVLCEHEVKSVEKTETGFQIVTDRSRFLSDAIIVASGGKAGPQYGSTGDGYRIAKAFGHTIIRLMPSLVQLVSDAPYFKSLKGVRAKGKAELLRDGLTVDAETGEIQFAEDGLSGICIFNLSREYVRGDMIKIDLFPKYGEENLEDIILKRKKTLENRRMPDFFGGILHKKLIPVVLAELALAENRKAAELKPEEVKKIVKLLKGWTIPVTGTKGWKEAQVTAGGVDLAEIDPDTMESKLVPGLYFAGEILNVDGKCGGYNLQWAWTSGMAAGKSAAASQG